MFQIALPLMMMKKIKIFYQLLQLDTNLELIV